MFDTLIETSRVHKRSHGFNTLMIVIGLHIAVIAGIAIQKFMEIPPIHEPPLEVLLAAVAAPPPPPPPPPPAPAASAAKQTPKTVETPKPNEIVQPTQTPDKVENSGGSTQEGGVQGGVEGGVEGGEVGGVIGGVLGGVPSDSSALPTGPLRIGGDVSAPVLIQRVQPEYPPLARSSRITGVVELEAVIRRDGSVGDIKVVRGVRGGLTESAIAAVKQWRYQPGMQKGVPVDVYMNVKVSFELS